MENRRVRSFSPAFALVALLAGALGCAKGMTHPDGGKTDGKGGNGGAGGMGGKDGAAGADGGMGGMAGSGGMGGSAGMGGGGGAAPKTCSAPADCASGNCVDGYCCDTACAGTCEACNLGSALGVCSAIADGMDPADDCTGKDTCGGVCDGKRACRFPAATVPCGMTTCSAGSVTGMLCDGAGACAPTSPKACDPFVCDAAGTACKTSCAVEGDCAAGAFCDTGLCKPKKAMGGACKAAGDCATGFCADGVCCSSTCSGSCESCNLAGMMGTCTKVKSADDADTCTTPNTCDAGGACKKKTGQACMLSTDCATNVCADGICCGTACGACKRCDMTPGTCTDVPAGMDPDNDCGSFACNGAGACATTCTGTCSTACEAGRYCSGGMCLPGKVAAAACTAACECSSGFCNDGFCCASDCSGACKTCAAVPGSCTNVAANLDPKMMCAGGLTCDGMGTCRPDCGADAHCEAGFYCTAKAAGTCMMKQDPPAACAPDDIDAQGHHQCNTNACYDGVCCSGSCGSQCQACNIAPTPGVCTSRPSDTDPDNECGAYTCSGTPACYVACTADANCKPDHYCDNTSAGICVAKKADAAGCAADPVDGSGNHQCLSNLCTTGMCAPSCMPKLDSSELIAGASPASEEANFAAAVNDEGKLSVIYHDQDIFISTRYVRFQKQAAGSGWDPPSDADASASIYGGLAMVYEGATARAYYQLSGSLYTVARSGSTWGAPTSILGTGAHWTRVGIDAASTIHGVDFYGSTTFDTLRHFWRPSAGIYTGEMIDGDTVSSNGSMGFAVEPDGTAHVAYADTPVPVELTYGKKAPADLSWGLTPIDTPVGSEFLGYGASLAVDPAGKVHVVYRMQDSSGATVQHQLRYATNKSGSWAVTQLYPPPWCGSPPCACIVGDLDPAKRCDEVLSQTGIAADSRGVVITYSNDSTGDLVALTNSVGSWKTFVVEDGTGGAWQSQVVITPDTTVHAVSWNSSSTELRHAVLDICK